MEAWVLCGICKRGGGGAWLRAPGSRPVLGAESQESGRLASALALGGVWGLRRDAGRGREAGFNLSSGRGLGSTQTPAREDASFASATAESWRRGTRGPRSLFPLSDLFS